MLFNSFAFAVFLPIVFILFWILPQKYRWTVLLLSSYYYYMSWNVNYVVLLLLTTGISYGCARLLERTEEKRKKKAICGVAVLAALLLLFFFKYFNFVNGAVAELLQRMALDVHPMTLKLMLPIGISFYTFKTVAYVIDVYRGTIKAEKHFGVYATFISFFPQILAGPIERGKTLIPQIRKAHPFHYGQATYGLKLIALGFLKKVVIADNLVNYVDMVYNDLGSYSGFAFGMATLLFTIQIYCDFSGYSDMAMGTAKLLGIDIMTNFNSPYFSFTIKEFWSRWHISLSTWFRDYVYIPLGGNRVGKVRHNLNLMITFLVSGFWHGANWTFILWGGLHGLYQIIEQTLFRRKNHRLFDKEGKYQGQLFRWILGVMVTFVLAAFAWIFFRANSIGDAVYVVTHLLDGITDPVTYLKQGYALIGGSISSVMFIAIPILLLTVYDFFSLKTDLILAMEKRGIVFRWIVYLLLGVLILLFATKGEGAEFVYLQF